MAYPRNWDDQQSGAALPQSLTLDDALHQANIVEKARSLADRGYSGYWIDPVTVVLTGPSGRSYCINHGTAECDCLGYRRYGMCSHSVGYFPLVCQQEVPHARI